MIEIKCAGRGGQGAVVFAEILAKAVFYDKNYSQAMPIFGVERRGAPSSSFIRISKQPISIRQQIYSPDVLVVLDPSLINDALVKCVKKNGVIIVNSTKQCMLTGYRTYCADASAVALCIFGSNIVNTAMLGAVTHSTDLVSFSSLMKAVEEKFEGNQELIEKNKKAIQEVYDSCQKNKCMPKTCLLGQ